MAVTPKRQVLRIIDANANRCREGLRVAEDVLRLGRGQAGGARELKAIRHALEAALARLAAPALLLAARRAEDDPGAGYSSAAERSRKGLDEVLRANLKRAQESLRVLEEVSKLVAGGGVAFKRLRFRCYSLEKKLDGKFARAKDRRESPLPGKRAGKGG